MSIQSFDHHIQREIFLRLRHYDVAKYSDICIKSVEPSLFMYHLKELIKMGLVEKVDKGRYQLTRKGLATNQSFSSEKKNIRISPLSYTLIFAKSKDNKWLVLKRHKQPHIFKLGCLSGKIHLGETAEQAANREWHDFTELTGYKLECKGYVSVLINDNQGVITHITGPVWFVDDVKSEWSEKLSRHGLLTWMNWEEIDYDEFIPGWREIVEKIESNDTFMLDLSFTL
jgi:DNA-binding transcriptional ArsR family regulator